MGRGWYDGLSLNDMRTYLRHLYGEPLTEYDQLFEEISRVAHERAEAIFSIFTKVDNESGFDKADVWLYPHIVEFMDTCYSVLRQLDSEGVFGKGEARQKVIINFLTTEDDEEPYLDHAGKLNPLSVVERCRTELSAANRIRQIISTNQRAKSQKKT